MSPSKKETVPKKTKTQRILGIGRFSSGVPDLASNPKHLEGFGQDSMPSYTKRSKTPATKARALPTAKSVAGE